MSTSFRQSMTWLHTWAGLIFCWVLYFIFTTGSLGYFDSEIDAWMQPEIYTTSHDPTQVQNYIQSAEQWLRQQDPQATDWYIRFPSQRENPQLEAAAHSRDPDTQQRHQVEAQLDVLSGEPLQPRATGGGQTLYKMHYLLHYFPGNLGYRLVGLITLLMFIGLITGIVIHKKIFKDFFTFRPHKRRRSWLDLHNLLSVSSLPFQLMITYSGLIFVISLWMPLVGLGSYGFDIPAFRTALAQLNPQVEVQPSGEPATQLALPQIVAHATQQLGDDRIRLIHIKYPHDQNAQVTIFAHAQSIVRLRDTLIYNGVTGSLISERPASTNTTLNVHSTFLGLHEGLFAEIGLRWLYFLSGLLGMGMVASGAIYWCLKRKTDSLPAGQRLVRQLNIGTFIGLPIAIAAYFWANRLLPLELAERGDWEVHCLFITWLLTMIHPLLRPHRQAWLEQLSLAALAFCLLPVLNALSTERGLWNSFWQHDWVFVGFDLSCLVFGLVCALVAVKLQQHWPHPSHSPDANAMAKDVTASERSPG